MAARDLALALALASIAACGACHKKHRDRRSQPTPGSADATPAPPPAPFAPLDLPSRNLRIKRVGLLKQDLETALDLRGKDLCTELDTLSCLDEVHGLTLGGVSPYDRGVQRPWDVAPATAPLALERVVASGCARRLAQDREDPAAAVLWRALPDASLAAEREAAQRAYVATVYRRFLARDPDARESVEALAAQSGMTDDDWAWTICFAVGTSAELMFY